VSTEDVIDFYAGSWIGGDRAAVRQLLSPEADIEWNLDLAVDDEELVQTLNRIALFADSVTVVSTVCNDQGAVIVYDCAAPFGIARLAEFVTIDDGRITEVRQVYDTVAVTRFFPGLVEDEYYDEYED
jgi:ketosteroid isomerase-like protein